jgi:5-methylcytosine-specific restriction endonuclease McrA
LRNDKYIGINNASNTIRKSLIQIRGHACEECKNTRWKNLPINLTLHHINGDSKMNTLDNLLLLCWNCHSYTPNYGRKNLYSTRKDRRR